MVPHPREDTVSLSGRPRAPDNTAPCGTAPFARFAASVGLRPPYATHPATTSHPSPSSKSRCRKAASIAHRRAACVGWPDFSKIPVSYFFEGLPCSMAHTPAPADVDNVPTPNLFNRRETVQLAEAYYRITDPKRRRTPLSIHPGTDRDAGQLDASLSPCLQILLQLQGLRRSADAS